MRATSRYGSDSWFNPPDMPNPLDSLGDVQLLTGHPREAEAFYMQAAKQDPHFQNGGDWLKAAIARLMTGDQAGAEVSRKSTSRRDSRRRIRRQTSTAPSGGSWSGRRREGYRDLEAIARRPFLPRRLRMSRCEYVRCRK